MRSSAFPKMLTNASRYPRKPWSRFITSENQRFISNEAIDFLDKLLYVVTTSVVSEPKHTVLQTI
jgi:hypothetical protein